MNKQAKIEEARRLRVFIEANAELLTDDAALDIPDAFPMWSAEGMYTTGTRVRYNEKLYKCLQDHAAQSDWTPDVAVSLWVEVAPEGVIPEWKQPAGAQDAYMAGDKVKHNGKQWISTVDNNVWEPGVYGWSEL